MTTPIHRLDESCVEIIDIRRRVAAVTSEELHAHGTPHAFDPHCHSEVCRQLSHANNFILSGELPASLIGRLVRHTAVSAKLYTHFVMMNVDEACLLQQDSSIFSVLQRFPGLPSGCIDLSPPLTKSTGVVRSSVGNVTPWLPVDLADFEAATWSEMSALR